MSASDPLVMGTSRTGASAARLHLQVDGMHCAGCAATVAQRLRAVAGVTAAEASLPLHSATVDYDPRVAAAADLLRAVDDAGYRARVATDDQPAGADQDRAEAAAWGRRALWGVPLSIAAFATLAVPPSLPGAATTLQAGAALTACLIVGGEFLRTAFRQARRGVLGMDALVSAGMIAALIAGGLEVVRPDAHAHGMAFFDATLIPTVIAVGRYLEARLRAAASRDLAALTALLPQTASVRRGGLWQNVPLDQVRVDEELLVKAGARVPLDGVVTSGAGFVESAVLTGEALPVERQPGDVVLSGSLNVTAPLTLRVLRPAGEAALQRINRLLVEAQRSKPALARLTDRALGWFVPAVFVLAVLTFVWWAASGQFLLALSAAAAVLVTACPCAMGLATPMAVVAATGRAARQGILIKHAQALESAAAATDVVLDKTGTVTLGLPEVVEVVSAPGIDAKELLATAAAVEVQALHPLADAVVAAARAHGAESASAANATLVPGAGVQAEGAAGAGMLLVGNERLMESRGIDVAAWAEAFCKHRAAGRMPLLCAAGGRLLGMLVVADPPAAGSRDAVEQLRRMGLSVHLLSGDHPAAVSAVARDLDIADFAGGLLPEDKLQRLQTLQLKGKRTVLVGDGWNDAPAMAAADLGVAMGSGAELTAAAADAVLLRGDLRSLVELLRLGRRTVSVMRQNLVWALAYNVVLLPAAAGMLLPWGWRVTAAWSAAAMAASSISVVLNSLRLRR